MKIEKEKLLRFMAVIPVLVILVWGALRRAEPSDFTVKDLTSADETDMDALGTEVTEEVTIETTEEANTIYVHIGGEVCYPGVYEVDKDSRIYDVLLLAGGFTEDAATDVVNMAEPVKDGMQVIVPSEVSVNQAEDSRVNINRATKEQLMSLPGIGQSKAESIIRYREKAGDFKSPEDIMQIEGIKEGVYRKLEEYITVR